MKILIVDNDEAWVKSLSILLKNRGHLVTAFTNPVHADVFVRRVATSDRVPDLVLLDYVMPGMNGTELAQRMRRSLNSGCRLLLMSGHTDRIEDIDLEGPGIEACLEKPIDFDRLLQLIEQPRKEEIRP